MGHSVPWRLALAKLLALLAAFVVVVVGSGALALNEISQPLPPVSATPLSPIERQVDGPKPSPPWPDSGAAAVAVDELGLLASTGDTSPRPVASIAKVLTALLVLEEHPLTPGESGPSVTVTQEDVDAYFAAAADGQSVVRVFAGQELSEYQLLQALLLPSGNNIADLLARWVAGSVDAFVDRMNGRAEELAMDSTHFADASGLSPETASTPEDLVLLGRAAMRVPVLAEIVSQSEAILPVTGRVFNVNTAIGSDGIVGIKTGSTPEAGAGLLFAAEGEVDDDPVMIVGAILGRSQLGEAFADSKALAVAVRDELAVTRALDRSQPLASLEAAWANPVDVLPAKDVDLLGWPGMEIEIEVELDPAEAPLAAGTVVGSATIQLGEQSERVDLVTDEPLEMPGRRWRLLRRFIESGLIVGAVPPLTTDELLL
ncbi:MAG: D-alanyl-D-alanine carboxypeptidase [Chloroflexi bacterium]|nr:D-alanyl-D-alanine carboxypeptidase [Chloroflexota bacterium]